MYLFFRHILALLIPPLPIYSIIFFSFLLSDSDSGSHHPVSIYASSAMSLAFSRVVLKLLILTRSRGSMAEQYHTPSVWLWNCIAENYTNENEILFWFFLSVTERTTLRQEMSELGKNAKYARSSSVCFLTTLLSLRMYGD